VAKKRRGRYPKEFRRMAVEQLKSCDNIVALSKQLRVPRRSLYRWRDSLSLRRSQFPASHIHAGSGQNRGPRILASGDRDTRCRKHLIVAL
jgi:transposase-like protein